MINPNCNAYSEVWLHRMMNYIKDDIVGVACFNPKDKYWNNFIPILDLNDTKYTLTKRVLKKLFPILTDNHPIVETKFIDFVKKTKPDILFINFIGPALYLKKALAKLEIPVLIHVHGIDIFWDARNDSNQRPVHPLDYKFQVKNLIYDFKSVHFIVNSKFSHNKLLETIISPNYMSLKYFGVPTSPFNKKFNEDKLSVLYLGRFVDFKGPDLVIEAFINACNRGFNGTLTMVGDGPLKAMCLLIAGRSTFSDRIFFREPVNSNEAALYFREADIFTMHNCFGFISHQLEAFGVAIIEAMSYGTPVITGRSGGPEEIIQHNIDGFLVTPGNIEEHANTFILLQQNPELLRNISDQAQKKIASKFSDISEKQTLLKIMEIFK